MENIIENTAYQIVCEMIDSGFVESEPEGMDWEFTIGEILKKNFLPLMGDRSSCVQSNQG